MGLTEGLANAGVVAASVATQEAMTAANPAGALAGAAGKFGQSQPTVVVVGNQQGQTNASAAQSSTSAAPIPVPAVPATNTPGVVDEAAAQSAQSKKESALNKLRVAFSKSKAFKTAGANVKAKKEAASIGKAPVNGDVNVDASFPAAMPDTTVPDGDGKADHFSTTNTRISKVAPEFDGKFYASDPAIAVINVVDTYVTVIQTLSSTHQVLEPWTGRVYCHLAPRTRKEGTSQARPKPYISTLNGRTKNSSPMPKA